MNELNPLSPEIIAFYQDIPTPLVSDCLNRLPGSRGLQSYSAKPSVCGRAFTVCTRPGDNLYVHLALDLAEPGDVIVVAAGGDDSNAIVGEIMKRYAQSRAIAGFVIDGAIRDVAAFREDNFPCFARAVQHRGPYKDGPGKIGGEVSIGGLVVHHGDLIVADEDGILSMRPQVAHDLVEKVKAQREMEQKLMVQIDAGTLDRSWLTPLRQSLGLA